jgi:hypothetical protein
MSIPTYEVNGKQGRVTFDSAQSLMDIANVPGAGTMHAQARSYWNEPGSGLDAETWYALPFKSGDRIRNLMDTGWSEGATKIESAIASVEMPLSRNVRRRARWTDQGDELNMDRVRSGQLDIAWRGMHRTRTFAPTRVVIGVDACANCFTGAQEMFWRGAAALALASSLTDSGYDVQIVSGMVWTADSNRSCIRAVTKSYGGGFDLATLAASTACPAFFRCFSFCYAWNHMPKNFVAGESIGHAKPLEPIDIEDIDPQAFTVIAPATICNAGDCASWAANQLRRIEDHVFGSDEAA